MLEAVLSEADEIINLLSSSPFAEVRHEFQISDLARLLIAVLYQKRTKITYTHREDVLKALRGRDEAHEEHCVQVLHLALLGSQCA